MRIVGSLKEVQAGLEFVGGMVGKSTATVSLLEGSGVIGELEFRWVGG